MLLENGTYRAVVRDISVYLRGENERLTAALKLDCGGKELLHREWLELNDGTISDKTIKRLRECFPQWDGSIETLEQGFCVKDVDVDIVVENEQDREDPAKWWTRIRFMNAPGSGGGSAELPEKENRATLLTKYGARFRALAGGTPAAARPAPAQAGQHAAPPQRPVKAGPPAKLAAKAPTRTSSLEESWDAFSKAHPDQMREQLTDMWFALLARLIPNKDQADYTAEDWGVVLADINPLPF